ncbi:hypothetical protein HUJ04_007305 [Dendroctonus ponderosae]|nr:hypothetical protein HUJ04_007305 [Dendroctonus ponderosae]
MGEPAETDLLQAIRESLQKDGILGRFKGEIRAAVINVLNKNSDPGDAPEIPQETKLINELVREYLAWNGYLYTEQVMAAESYQTGERLTRDVLTTKMGVLDDAKTAKIPLLYYIVAAPVNSDGHKRHRTSAILTAITMRPTTSKTTPAADSYVLEATAIAYSI